MADRALMRVPTSQFLRWRGDPELANIDLSLAGR
jgi:hypothetical protein